MESLEMLVKNNCTSSRQTFPATSEKCRVTLNETAAQNHQLTFLHHTHAECGLTHLQRSYSTHHRLVQLHLCHYLPLFPFHSTLKTYLFQKSIPTWNTPDCFSQLPTTTSQLSHYLLAFIFTSFRYFFSFRDMQ